MTERSGLGWPEEKEAGAEPRPTPAQPSGLGWPQGTDGVHPRAEEDQ